MNKKIIALTLLLIICLTGCNDITPVVVPTATPIEVITPEPIIAPTATPVVTIKPTVEPEVEITHEPILAAESPSLLNERTQPYFNSLTPILERIEDKVIGYTFDENNFSLTISCEVEENFFNDGNKELLLKQIATFLAIDDLDTTGIEHIDVTIYFNNIKYYQVDLVTREILYIYRQTE